MAMIHNFAIDKFRGINQLTVNNLNHINLIVGDNNSGKTSILEALQLLRNPGDIANVLRVARTRDVAMFSSGISIYENFVCMFPHDDDKCFLGISARSDVGELNFHIQGQRKRILVDASERTPFSHPRYKKEDLSGEQEADAFIGEIQFQNGTQGGMIPIELHEFSRLYGLSVNRNDAIKMSYVSPCDHLRGNIINRIIRNDSYKEICIAALRLFDPEIVDILLLKSTISTRPVEYLKHRTLGIMPISTYGDGIKKVLTLANAIAQATNGILLIDEIETAIHKKYYDDIFRFIVKACKTFHVQAFITTHSIEAVDGLLVTQDYAEQRTDDDISVVTVKRLDNQSYSRVLSGRDVATDREAFGFEVLL